MHLSDNVASMHLVPVEDGQPRTLDMLDVDGVLHKPSHRRISFTIILEAVAAPRNDLDSFLNELVHFLNHNDLYCLARRCGDAAGEQSNHEIVALVHFKCTFARSFLHFAFFPAEDGRLVVRVDAWSWEQLSNVGILVGPSERSCRGVRTEECFLGAFESRDLLLRYVRDKTPRPSEEAIKTFVLQNAHHPADVRRRARQRGNVSPALGAYEFRGASDCHQDVLLRMILSVLLPQYITRPTTHNPEPTILVYENGFEFYANMTWEIRSSCFVAEREMVTL